MDQKRALELWVRLRLELIREDPMSALIGAAGRCMESGMTPDQAVDYVLRILKEEGLGG